MAPGPHLRPGPPNVQKQRRGIDRGVFLQPERSISSSRGAVICCGFWEAILRGLAGQNAIQLIKPPEACHVFRDQVIIGKILLIQATERE